MGESVHPRSRHRPLWYYLRRDRYLYLMFAPVALYFILFRYWPIYGVTVAFQKFRLAKGWFGSPFIGLQNFRELFADKAFQVAFVNTWVINGLRILVGFPVPVLFALLLNEVRSVSVKRVVQTITYLPHFISWVVLAGIFTSLFAKDTGAVNQFLELLGIQRVDFLLDNRYFRAVVIGTGIWRDMGWNTIIYLAAIASINPELYESALVDGAGRFQRMVHITLPGISNIIVVVFILWMGRILWMGFEQIYNLYTPLTYESADIIDTYVVRQLTQYPNYGRLAAAGFVKSVVGVVILILANSTVKLFGKEGIY
jgi:putative aldouronate transport system permease protein